MSRLSRRIREREVAIGVDRRNIAAAVTELRVGVRRRLSSPSTLCAVFGGGLVLGWISGGREPSRAVPAAESSQAAPPRSRAASMTTRLAREVLWPIGVGALRVQLKQFLAETEAQPKTEVQRR